MDIGSPEDREGAVGHGPIPFSGRLLEGTDNSSVPCELAAFLP